MDRDLLIGIAGIAIGAIGIAIGIYESRKYKGPKICFQFDGMALIRKSSSIFLKEIDVKFDGMPILNLTKSQVVIWNDGKSPIRKSDIVGDNLKISFYGSEKILQSSVTKFTNISNGFALNHPAGSSQLEIIFDYLDPGDGALLDIWHCSVRVVPKVEGAIIGRRSGPFNAGRFIGPRPNVVNRTIDESDLLSQYISYFSKLLYGAHNIIPIATTFIGLFGFLYGAAWCINDIWGIGGDKIGLLFKN